MYPLHMSIGNIYFVSLGSTGAALVIQANSKNVEGGIDNAHLSMCKADPLSHTFFLCPYNVTSP